MVAEETAGNITVYIYDAEGTPIGMQYHGASYASGVWDCYWYEKNLLGDIVAVYNNSGTKLVSYVYDAWGAATVTYSNGGESTTAASNPFRYRGYYYDIDLGLYRTGTRYYDAVVGRFISPDIPEVTTATPMSLTDKNLFAYCDNNPVMRVDHGGEFWGEIWNFIKTTVSEIGKTIQVTAPAYAGCGGVVISDGPLPFGDLIGLAGATLLTVGVIGYGIYQASKIVSASNVDAKGKMGAVVVPKNSNGQVVFPSDPNTFNPVGLVRIYRDGTKNGSFVSWMDPVTRTEVFRWDENPNFSNGPHYHIYGTGHYYSGMVVPEPYATIYFPYK